MEYGHKVETHYTGSKDLTASHLDSKAKLTINAGYFGYPNIILGNLFDDGRNRGNIIDKQNWYFAITEDDNRKQTFHSGETSFINYKDGEKRYGVPYETYFHENYRWGISNLYPLVREGNTVGS